MATFTMRRSRMNPWFYLAAAGVVLALNVLFSANIHDILRRTWEDLMARPSGPLAFRFLLQPVMATIVAIRDGIGDAHGGRSPYFWTVLSNPEERQARLGEGLRATARIMALALLIDAAYQYLALGKFYPGEAIIIAVALAFLPYLLVRGPVARLARWWGHHPSSPPTH